MTTLIAMVSPSFQYAKESNNTLLFANSCSHVSNVVRPNKYKKSIPSSVPVTVKKKEVKVTIPWKKTTDYDEIYAMCDGLYLDSKTFGSCFILKAGQDEWPNKIILIHGCPSSSEEFLH